MGERQHKHAGLNWRKPQIWVQSNFVVPIRDKKHNEPHARFVVQLEQETHMQQHPEHNKKTHTGDL